MLTRAKVPGFGLGNFKDIVLRHVNFDQQKDASLRKAQRFRGWTGSPTVPPQSQREILNFRLLIDFLEFGRLGDLSDVPVHAFWKKTTLSAGDNLVLRAYKQLG